jgi:arylsulfatase A-like enzyme
MKKHMKFAALSMALLAGTSAVTSSWAQADRSVLPIPAPPFDGKIAENAADAAPAAPRPVRAPQGAPNVLLFMADDVGFAMSSVFGGPVPTPNMAQLAAGGQRYNRFHVTGICSPSRAALLTGRNHHNAGNGYLSDLPAPFPGYGGRMLPETATIAQVLRLNGYNTAMFGKHHNTPGEDRSAAGPFDSWPTGLGFEYYFGFPHGDTDQFEPAMYRGTQMVDPEEGKGDMADKRLADDLMRWVRNQKIARFKGQFDQGWDRMREAILRRQIALGVVPRGTRLTPRPPEIPAWDALTPGQKAFAARSMEVAAAQLAYQDEQLGRIVAELARIGQLDKTLIAVIQGDNGASAEAGPMGTINELRSMGRNDEDPAWLEANTQQLGSRMTYGSYPAGWAWAMNTPLRWMKQRASMLGGVRQGMIMSWSGHVARPGSLCSQFGHLIDMAPTIYEAAGLPMPRMVLGTAQKPLDGQSLLPSLQSCDAAHPRTQYFEISGSVGLYHNGWFASADNGRSPWEIASKNGGARPRIDWTLYNLDRDFAQGQDLAAQYPAKLAELQAIWQREAERNHVFPLNHIFGPGRGGMAARASSAKHFDFWGKDVSIPASSNPVLLGRSFTLNADVVLAKADASGAVLALGSQFGGWSLWLDHGKPTFTWAQSTDPKEITVIRAAQALPQGAATLTLRFASQGMGRGADITISSGGVELARGTLPVNYLMPAGGGETLDIGRDLGVTVTKYPTPRGQIEGDVPHVAVDFD